MVKATDAMHRYEFEVEAYPEYGIGCSVVRVTPEIAAHWLETKMPNRNIKKKNIDRFASSMVSGRWALGPVLLFTKAWRLLDGQNRLEAVLKCEIPVLFICVYGIPEESFKVIDDRQQRNASDVLQMMGKQNTKIVSSVLRFVNDYDTSLTGSRLSGKRTDLTNDQVPELIKKYHDIENILPFETHSRKFPRYSTLLSCYYIFSRINRDLADRFFVRLNSGEGLSKGDPIYALRERLISERGKTQSYPTSLFVYSITVKSWNAYREGRTIGTLKWMAGEAVPEPK
jgi:hypothetical protein